MSTMAAVSQPSRLLAKLRMACVRAPGGARGGLGATGGLGAMGSGGSCCPLVAGLGIAVVLGSKVVNGVAAPWWGNRELQLCWGPGVGYSGVLPPGGGIGNCSSGGSRVGSGVLPLLV